MKRKNYLLSILFTSILPLLLIGCKEEVIPQVPTVVTFSVSDIEQQSATCGGLISSESAITARGVCWSKTHQSPTISDSISIDGTETGSFSSYLQNLKPDSTYYVRAYATSSVGTGYGSVMKFKTKKATVNVVTLPMTEILLSAATGAAQVTADKGTVISERGLCWSTLSVPTINDSKIASGQGDGSFTANLTQLTSNTTYYVRAYATANNVTIYGSLIIFKTRQIALNITTLTINEITQTTAKCGGIVSCDIPTTITAFGVCWSTSVNPTIADNKTVDGLGTGSFTSNISNLIGNTPYYLRAYATNMEGTAYGSTMTFKTNPIVPSVSTLAVNNITSNSAKCDAKILNNGGSTILTYGVCYSTTSNPTLSDNFTSESAPTDNFTHSLTNLNSNTKYYLRSYAINAVGTSYGNEVQFITIGDVIFNENLTYGSIADNEGNDYKTIQIGTQIWMAENLRSTKYRNGDLIPTTALSQDISTETSPNYYWTKNNPIIYGNLYTWFTTIDSRNICPVGWHIPSDAEWTTLTNYLGGSSVAGNKLREIGTLHWGTTYNNGLATNSSGFTALPTGYRISISFPYENGCAWWSSTSSSSTNSYCRQLIGNVSSVSVGSFSKKEGYSIRCIKD